MSLSAFKTPMMQQYARIKSEYKDTLLFFRLGDFYELFLEDAELGSKILDITLTARHKGADGKIPMCGVPYHAIDNYLQKIVKAGYKAAICEQLESTDSEEKIVEREVVRIISPGTIVDEKMLDNKSNNYLMTFLVDAKTKIIHIAYSDISTGELVYTSSNFNELYSDAILSEMTKINPSELVLPNDLYNDYNLLKSIKSNTGVNITKFETYQKVSQDKVQFLLDFFKVKSLNIFEIDEANLKAVQVISLLLNYLMYTQKGNLFHINKIKNESNKNYLKLDSSSIKNLEIFYANKSNLKSTESLSFVESIDKTSTPMGSRLLKYNILNPLLDKNAISKKLESVEFLTKSHKYRETLSRYLSEIRDLERIISRIGTKSSNARDLVSLKTNLYSSQNLFKLLLENADFLSLTNIPTKSLEELNNIATNITDTIDKSITDEPPVSIREGGMIKDNINYELDAIKTSILDSQKYIGELESIERAKTQISNLKVGFNSVFGYYIEISKANNKNVPIHYIRKQTLVNAERYITPELKEKEEIVLSAKEKINNIEYKIFVDITNNILKEASNVQAISKIIAEIDILVAFTTLALERNYIKPEILEPNDFEYSLTDARHPVIETFVGSEFFTPNNTTLTKNSFFHLITGPNMAGKSTYIRQVALIQLMAQIGMFVPASSAKIAIVDAIYTRIGSSDALSQGLSTFMVEMLETAKILTNATSNSLVILDEVGRGTSTLDGLSIAKAIVEHIHNKIKCKTLFATHFHELTTLDQRLKHLENYHVRVVEDNGEIKFLHKVQKGGTNKSYGIEVAKLAGMPIEVVNRAKELLSQNEVKQIKFDI